MTESGDFIERTTKNGIRLHVEETGKFKTTLIHLFLRLPLGDDATRAALLPPLLKRGTRRDPGMTQLERRLESLYGAECVADVSKMGDAQVLDVSVSLPNERFLAGAQELLAEGVAFLAEILLRPATDNGGFRTDYLEQEKENLGYFIESLVDDKVSYADEMLIRRMCAGEPYGIYEYGRIEELPGIGAADLYRFHETLLQTAPMDIYVCGDVAADPVLDMLEEAFDFPRHAAVEEASPMKHATPAEERTVREEQDVQQGNLCLGYRTFTTAGDPDGPAMVCMNGVLGGFSHSKLFKNVREKESMAYYAGSSFDRLKGLLTIASGIDADNYDRAVACIRDQVQAVRDGAITDEEMSNTHAALRNRLRSIEDSPSRKIAFLMQQRLAGRHEPLREIMETLSAVTKDDVVRAARKLRLDTIYFLAPAG